MAIYMAFLVAQSEWPEGLVWPYPVKTVAVAAALLGFRKKYEELRVPWSSAAEVDTGRNVLVTYTLAVAVGLVAIVVWIGVDRVYPGRQG
jgi:hypothetical protein